MPKTENFEALVNLALSSAENLGQIRPVIEKELLHYDILFSLDAHGLLNPLTFQGGTALRLCYGSSRYSEDLDFSAGKQFERAIFLQMKECLETYVGQRYGLEVNVKEPGDLEIKEDLDGIHVDRWQLIINTAPKRKDLPNQQIKIEITNVPAYSRVPRPLKKNYAFLPDGYEDLLIMTESLEEIMADKIVSLVNSRKYIRHRDIWDIRWLMQHNISLSPQILEWVHSKIQDYQIKDYAERLETFLRTLPEILKSAPFRQEMSRFLTQESRIRTLDSEKFLVFLEQEILTLFNQVKQQLHLS